MLTKRPETPRKIPGDPGKGLLPKFRVERFAMLAIEFRLVVPRINMTETTGTEDLDDVCRCGWKMSGPGCQRICDNRICCKQSIITE